MAADDEEAAKNDNYGADAVALASELLGGVNIMDEEEESLKENLIVAVDAPAEAITAGIVAANGPKKNNRWHV